MIKAIVTGAAGGWFRIINVLSTSEGIALGGALERTGHAQLGRMPADRGHPATG